jgi:putative ABC transport system substrate-binding protein
MRTSGEFERAYAEAKQAADEAVDVLASPFFNANRERLVQLASRDHLPAIYESREYAVAGGFIWLLIRSPRRRAAGSIRGI